MKKVLKVAAWVVGSIAAALVLLIAISFVLYPPKYMIQILQNGESKITDYQVFPERVIAKSSKPYQYEYALDDSLGEKTVTYSVKGEKKTLALDEMVAENSSTSFIVVHNDKVVYEKYFNGYDKDSIETSFSSVKSLNSLLIGMAIEDGLIKSVNDPISDYISEYRGNEFANITIEQLLLMRSKIDYNEGFVWFTDDALTYWYPDLRNLALHKMRVDKNFTGQFHYNNYHPLIEGIILERATGMHVADYFQKKIWGPIGAQYDASWSLDSEETGFEKMESGLNFISIDYAKIGSMLLHRGNWNGEQVVSEAWLDQSLVAPNLLTPEDCDTPFMEGKPAGYQYHWYSIVNDKGGKDFYAHGKYSEHLYVSPDHNTVIVRTGYDAGEVGWWPPVLAQVAALVDGQ
jgi:CubicO group peptidase (beta-lactamase class C family)